MRGFTGRIVVVLAVVALWAVAQSTAQAYHPVTVSVANGIGPSTGIAYFVNGVLQNRQQASNPPRRFWPGRYYPYVLIRFHNGGPDGGRWPRYLVHGGRRVIFNQGVASGRLFLRPNTRPPLGNAAAPTAGRPATTPLRPNTRPTLGNATLGY
jgi:hypothetical protein